MVIDLFGLLEADVRVKFPRVYQHIWEYVRPKRIANRREYRREGWWLFGENIPLFRQALNGLPRYIVTVETARIRYFEFLNSEVLSDNKVVAIASKDSFSLGVLCSRVHITWALRAGGWIGAGNDPVYVKSECFDPFPFPAANDAQKSTIRALAEELDALRKRVIAETSFLTMTKLYNVRERLKAIEAGKGAPLDESERAIHDKGCVSVIHELHKKIDAAVADAYGWPVDLADEDVLARLVALNKERAEEEKNGIVRWLRPDYQIARAKKSARKQDDEEQIEAELVVLAGDAPSLPRADGELIAAVRSALRAINRPVAAIEIARRFKEKGRGAKRVERGLQLLAAAGVARRAKEGWFIPAGGHG